MLWLLKLELQAAAAAKRTPPRVRGRTVQLQRSQEHVRLQVQGFVLFVMLPSAEALIKAKQCVEKVQHHRRNPRHKTRNLSSRPALTSVRNWEMQTLRRLCCCIWCGNRTLQHCDCPGREALRVEVCFVDFLPQVAFLKDVEAEVIGW
jgi:hypothetical protein